MFEGVLKSVLEGPGVEVEKGLWRGVEVEKGLLEGPVWEWRRECWKGRVWQWRRECWKGGC